MALLIRVMVPPLMSVMKPPLSADKKAFIVHISSVIVSWSHFSAHSRMVTSTGHLETR